MFIRIKFETRAQRKARKNRKNRKPQPLFASTWDDALKNATIVK